MTLEEFYNYQAPEINQIKEWCEEIFGIGNVDIQHNRDFSDSYNNNNCSIDEWFNKIDRYCYTVYIHLPERTVTNEHNNSHKVYDGYVRLFLLPNNCLCPKRDIGYTRAKMTKKELDNGYMFSHCFTTNNEVFLGWENDSKNNSEIDPFRDLCFGSGPILTSMSRLQQVSSEENWRLFLNDLDNYFDIESFAGGPYVSLENLYSIKELPYTLHNQFQLVPPLLNNQRNILMEFMDYLYTVGYFDNISYAAFSGVPIIATHYTELYEKICESFINFIEMIKQREDFNNDIQEALNYFTVKYLRIEEPDRVITLMNDSEPKYSQYPERFNMGFTFNGEPVFFDVMEETNPVTTNSHIGFSIEFFNRLLNSITRCIIFHFDNYERALFL